MAARLRCAATSFIPKVSRWLCSPFRNFDTWIFLLDLFVHHKNIPREFISSNRVTHNWVSFHAGWFIHIHLILIYGLCQACRFMPSSIDGMFYHCSLVQVLLVLFSRPLWCHYVILERSLFLGESIIFDIWFPLLRHIEFLRRYWDMLLDHFELILVDVLTTSILSA